MHPIRAERDYEHWLFNSIKNIFRVHGFRFSGFFPTQRQEHRLPFDVAHWVEMSDFVKVIGFQVKALYYDGDIFEPIDENNLFYIIDTDQLTSIEDKNERYGSDFIFVALPRYYESYLDELAALFFNYIYPKELLRVIRERELNFPKEKGSFRLRYREQYKYYCFGKLFRDFFRCKVGLALDKKLFERKSITSKRIMQILMDLSDPEGERRHVSLLIVANFTRLEALIVFFQSE